MTGDYLRQVIVVRKDLCMPTGKLAAMVAHASMTFLLKAFRSHLGGDLLEITPEQRQWLTEFDPGLEHLGQVSMAKIVCQVPNLAELVVVDQMAMSHRLTCYRVYDSGHSHNKPGDFVCVAVGPALPEALQPVTGHLKVYR